MMETLLKRNTISSEPYLVTIKDDGEEEVSEIPDYQDRLKSVEVVTVESDDDAPVPPKKDRSSENAVKYVPAKSIACAEKDSEILELKDEVITLDDAPSPQKESSSKILLAESFSSDFSKKKLYMFFDGINCYNNYYMETEEVEINRQSNLEDLKKMGEALAIQMIIVKSCSERLELKMKEWKLEVSKEIPKNIFDKFVKNCVAVCNTKRCLDIETKEALVISLTFENSNPSLKAAVLSIITEMRYITFGSKDDSLINDEQLNCFRDVATMILQNCLALKLRGWQVKEMTSEIRNCFFANDEPIFTSPSLLLGTGVITNDVIPAIAEMAASPLILNKQATKKAPSAKFRSPVTVTASSPIIATASSPITATASSPITATASSPITATASSPITVTASSPVTFTASSPVTSTASSSVTATTSSSVTSTTSRSVTATALTLVTATASSSFGNYQSYVDVKREKLQRALNNGLEHIMKTVSANKRKRTISKNRENSNEKANCPQSLTPAFNTSRTSMPQFYNTINSQDKNVKMAPPNSKRALNGNSQPNKGKVTIQVLSVKKRRKKANCKQGELKQNSLVNQFQTAKNNTSGNSVANFSNTTQHLQNNDFKFDISQPNGLELITNVISKKKRKRRAVSKKNSNSNDKTNGAQSQPNQISILRQLRGPNDLSQSNSNEKANWLLGNHNPSSLVSQFQSANDLTLAAHTITSSVPQLSKTMNFPNKDVTMVPPNQKVNVSQPNPSEDLFFSKTISKKNNKQPASKIQLNSNKKDNGTLGKQKQTLPVSHAQSANDVSQTNSNEKANWLQGGHKPSSLAGKFQGAKEITPAFNSNSNPEPYFSITTYPQNNNVEMAPLNSTSVSVLQPNRSEQITKTISKENNKQNQSSFNEKVNDIPGKQNQTLLLSHAQSANDLGSPAPQPSNTINLPNKDVEMVPPNLCQNMNISLPNRSNDILSLKTISKENNTLRSASMIHKNSNEQANSTPSKQSQMLPLSRAQNVSDIPLTSSPATSSIPQLYNTTSNLQKKQFNMAPPNIYQKVNISQPNRSEESSKTNSRENNKELVSSSKNQLNSNEKVNGTQGKPSQLPLLSQSQSVNSLTLAFNTTKSPVSRFLNSTNSQNKDIKMARPNLNRAVANSQWNRSEAIPKSNSRKNNEQPASKIHLNSNEKVNETQSEPNQNISFLSQSPSANNLTPAFNTTNASVPGLYNTTNLSQTVIANSQRNRSEQSNSSSRGSRWDRSEQSNSSSRGSRWDRPEHSNSCSRNFYNNSRILPRFNLRPIAIDGTNVAYSFGQSLGKYSFKGIELCVNHFLRLGHRTVHVFIPQLRSLDVADGEIMRKLESKQIVVITPSGLPGSTQFDKKMVDRFICDYAVETGAIIVSNDSFPDLMNESRQYHFIIKNRLLVYTFTRDLFLFPKYPLGSDGPTLDTFLSF